MTLSRIFHRKFTDTGAPPGEFVRPSVHVEPRVLAMSYAGEQLEERQLAPAEAKAVQPPPPGRVTWIDVQGLGDGSLVQDLGATFGLHGLALADVVNTGQRPKVEDYDDGLFFVVRMAALEDGRVSFEQVSLFLQGQVVLSFQERPGDCFDPLREHIRAARSKLRQSGADYLVCMLLDFVVDGYFPVLEEYGERLEEIEAAVVADPTPDLLGDIYAIKRDLLAFRRAVWPLRDALSRLLRGEEPALSDSVLPYLRDTTDHVMQVVDVVETHREIASSLVDVYLSGVGQRTNETMRVLTVIATIFIPLTFLAGVFGMNFDTSKPGNMPELSMPYGYVLFWIVCVVLLVVLLVVFRRRGWLGPRDL